MKNFYLNFNMNHEDGKTVQFIDELEEFEESLIVRTEEGHYYPEIDEPIANIYVSSTGGENRMAAIVYHFFSTSPFNYRFTVNGEFSSNAILILLALNPKYITIMRQCMSVVHLSSYNHPVSNIVLNDPSHSSLNDLNDFKDYLNSMLELYKTFLTKEELTIIKQGGDIALSAQRVAELFERLKKDKGIQKKAKKIFEITL